MKKHAKVLAFCAAVGLGLFPGVTHADSLAAPGFYNGSGNSNANFTTSTQDGIELGLRAKYRGGPDVVPTATGTYSFPTGGVGPLATWNYDFSINTGSLGLAGLSSATLTILDVNTTFSQVINVLTYWADSATYDAGGVHQNGSGLLLGSQLGIQNSENLGFGDSPLAGDFNPSSGDTYDFTLAVSYTPFTQPDFFTNSLSPPETHFSTTIHVNAVPEPATMTLLGVGLAGIFAARRKRRV